MISGARILASSGVALVWVAVFDVAARAHSAQGSIPTPVGLAVIFGVALLLGAAFGCALWALFALGRIDGPARPVTGDAIAALCRAPLLGIAGGTVVFALPLGVAIFARAALLQRSAAAAAAVDLLAVAIGWLLLLLWLKRFGRRGGRAVRPRAAGLVLGGLGLAAAGTFFPHRAALSASDLWDLVLIGDGALICAAAALLLPEPRRSRRFAVAWALLSVAAGAASLFALQVSEDLRDETATELRPGAWITGLLAHMVDLDGDGFSPLFGGGDCDDGRAEVNPAAIEIPGNGVDENCRNGDRIPGLPWAPRPAFAPLPKGVPEPKSILLVTVDSLRPDHLSAYGYGRPTSPRLEAMAATSFLFTRAFSSAPTTRLAIPILHTGRFAGLIPWDRRSSPYAMRPGVDTVAEILKRERGFVTAAFITHRYLGPRWGWSRGFDLIDDRFALPDEELRTAATGAPLAEEVASWIEAHKDARFFAWVHLLDPHQKYLKHVDAGAPDFGDTDADLYDSEVWYTDRAIGRLLDALEAAGIAESTMVVITADHGEALGEHGRSAHGGNLYEEVARVPLILHAPGLAPGRTACVTGHVDLAPTILNFVGVDGSGYGMSGASLVPELTGTPCPRDREIVLELRYGRLGASNLRALVGSRWKLVADINKGTYRLFDLEADPHERVNVVHRQPRIFREMKGRLDVWTEVYADRETADIAAEFTSDEAPAGARRIDAVFGNGVELVAADLGEGVAARGYAPEIAAYFRVREPAQRDCRIVLTLVDAAGKIRFTQAHDPVNGTFPVSRWPRGRVVEDRFALELVKSPFRIPDGAYAVNLGLTCDGADQGLAAAGQITVDSTRVP